MGTQGLHTSPQGPARISTSSRGCIGLLLPRARAVKPRWPRSWRATRSRMHCPHCQLATLAVGVGTALALALAQRDVSERPSREGAQAAHLAACCPRLAALGLCTAGKAAV